MANRETTAKVVDEIIVLMATSVAIASAMVLPNILLGLDKPLKLLYRKMDKRAREREARRIVYNMKAQGYLVGSYDHGLHLTDKARRRLEKATLDKLQIEPTPRWDHTWRITLYDIPEKHKTARNALHDRLRMVGCFQLQRSVWITPFPCRDIVETITSQYGVDEFVTYFEAAHLDNETAMIRLFAKKYPHTKF
ncbi:MAG: hypothetical protein WAQ24_01840 [Candidatus Saccharimonadales bacterium]